jgi:hypothetical protein
MNKGACMVAGLSITPEQMNRAKNKLMWMVGKSSGADGGLTGRNNLKFCLSTVRNNPEKLGALEAP